MKSRPTLTDLIKRRHAEDFVGRGSYLSSFEANLLLPVEQRRFIFSISGQAGVGKSYLLRRFRSVADAAGCVTAFTNDEETDISATLAKLVEQLQPFTNAFEGFLQRHRNYRQRREELEADPDLPPGAIAAAAKTAARVGLKLGRRAPAVGAVLDFVDDDSVADQFSEWVSFLARKLTNKDDVQLLRDPQSILTPLFVDGLARMDECPAIVLLFDTYETTATWIDGWLRDLIDGHFGDLPANLIVCVAGQYELDPALWALYAAVIAKMPLDVFTTDEASEYLARRGITDPSVIAKVSQLSDRLPLLVATLAEVAARGNDLTELSLTAVQRFLKWIPDPDLCEIAINAALPRRFNEDVLEAIAPQRGGSAAIEWLRRLPFVQDGFRYHELVRGQMLRLKLRQAPSEWSSLHSKLAQYYRTRAELQIAQGGTIRDAAWRASNLEGAYHAACERGDSATQFAILTFAESFENSVDYSEQMVITLRAAARDSDAMPLAETCDGLAELLSAYRSDQYAAASERYAAIARAAKGGHLETPTQLRYGKLLRYGNRPATAEKVLSNIIEKIRGLTDQSSILSQAYLERSECYRQMDDTPAALRDLDCAAQLRPKSPFVLFRRGRLLREMKRYDEALVEFAKAYENDDDKHSLEKERATTLEASGQYAAAADAAQRALVAFPACDDCWRIYSRVLARYLPQGEVVTRIERLPFQGSTPARALASRAIALEAVNDDDAALRDYDKALAEEPNLPRARVRRARLLQRRGDMVRARADFDAAVAAADPPDVQALFARAEFLRDLHDYPAAINEFELIGTRDPAKHPAFRSMALCYLQMGNPIAALASVEKALRAYADCDDCWRIYGDAAIAAYGREAVDELFAAFVPDADSGAATSVAAARGRVLSRLGLFETATRILTQAIESGGNTHELYEARARALAGLRHFTAAAADMGIAAELLGADGRRLQNQRGLWLSYDTHYAEAIAAYKASMANDYEFIPLYNIAVASALMLGAQNAQSEILAARAALKRAAGNESTKGAVAYGYGGLAAVEGREEEALGLLKQALADDSQATIWAAEDMAWIHIRSTTAFRALFG